MKNKTIIEVSSITALACVLFALVDWNLNKSKGIVVDLCALKSNASDIIFGGDVKLLPEDCFSYIVYPNDLPTKSISFKSKLNGEGISVSFRKY